LWRLVVAAGVGSAVGAAIVVPTGSWPIAVTSGWTAAALVLLGWVWLTVLPMDQRATATHARLEDPSRAVAETVLLSAATVSLVAVAFVLVDAAGHSGLGRAGFIGLALSSVATAWATVHTVFMLRYAHLFYADPVGGIDFHADDLPDYHDIAYVALTIGMTFQVSDTDLTARQIRRASIQHALLSYLFGAVILAIMINIVGSLAN
jgi:uncharacterized membrane protein